MQNFWTKICRQEENFPIDENLEGGGVISCFTLRH